MPAPTDIQRRTAISSAAAPPHLDRIVAADPGNDEAEATVLVTGLVLAGIAALVHVWIFYLESLAWTSERARATFRSGSVQEAGALQFMAFNQGFYNLFLAVVTALGIVVRLAGDHGVGLTLVLTGTGSMLAAAFVLFTASAPHRPAAVKQGLVPLLSVVAVLLSVTT